MIIEPPMACAVIAGFAKPVLALLALSPCVKVGTPAVIVWQEVLVAPLLVTTWGLIALVTVYLDATESTLLV